MKFMMLIYFYSHLLLTQGLPQGIPRNIKPTIHKLIYFYLLSSSAGMTICIHFYKNC